MRSSLFYFCLIGLFVFSCKIEKPKPLTDEVSESKTIDSVVVITKSDLEEQIPLKEAKPENVNYPFLKTDTNLNLTDLIPVPKGFHRVKVPSSSFAQWLRYLPAKPLEEKVKLYNGDLKGNQNAHFAIVDIDIGKRDLQQCADAVMRLKAEYNYSRKEFSKIHFNFTSGDKVAFDDWSRGKQPKVNGNKVTFSSPSRTINTSYPNFKKYMNMIFNYAGTMSLSKELKSVAIEEMEIGDVFIQGGFPGHAVIVIDMIENEKGEQKFLLAQSYMPAQNVHVLKNYENKDLNPWYSINFDGPLETPEWSFSKEDLKRF